MPKYEAVFDIEVLEVDLPQLAQQDPALVSAALAAVRELAAGHKTGTELGRNIGGDLTGLLRLRFDLPGVHPPRFRVVYRIAGDQLMVRGVGERRDHLVYRSVVQRDTDS